MQNVAAHAVSNPNTSGTSPTVGGSWTEVIDRSPGAVIVRGKLKIGINLMAPAASKFFFTNRRAGG